jgi:pyrimidine operon attenuation protein/uracil phosphoribosyltransferase
MKNQTAPIRRVQTWFVTALILKIASAAISLKLNDPMWFGFVIPMTVMLAYWAVGYRVRGLYDVRLTLAKFADSIYYLGFLFTVVSIIICLLDIQSIGENLTNMATRFGAAMVSTAIGMVARTLHVGFRPDQEDAVRSVEENAIRSAEQLAFMFDETREKLTRFRDEVVAISKETTAGAREQIEEIQKHSIAAMDTYFSNATQRSNEAFDAMLNDAKTASNDLLVTINGLADKSESTLERMESHALDFGNLATRRLEQTLFPDDLFASKLKPSIDSLSETTEGVNESIATLADDVKSAARAVGTSIRGLNTKTQALEETLQAVSAIVESQQRLMDAMNSNGSLMIEGVDRVQKEFLDTLDDYQKDFQGEIKSNREVTEKVADRLQALHKFVETDASNAFLRSQIDAAFSATSEVTIRANEAFSESIKTTLTPLIQAVAANNESHNTLAMQVTDCVAAIETAQSHLDEVVRKIDHINQLEVRQAAVNEPVLSAELENPVTPHLVQASPDVRPA